MIKQLLSVMLLCTLLWGGSEVPYDSEYQFIKNEKITVIYPEVYAKEGRVVADLATEILERYQKSYGVELDEPLVIGIASDNDQIANGFSTQLPHNRTILYGAGAAMVDYFTARSWLEVLITHELGHNHQLNVKANPVSQFLHTYLGNNAFPLFTPIVPIPLFTLPNHFVPTSMLEGNAVLMSLDSGMADAFTVGVYGHLQCSLQGRIKLHQVV